VSLSTISGRGIMTKGLAIIINPSEAELIAYEELELMASKGSAWGYFNLGGKDPDISAGLIYALRYSKNELRQKRMIVVNALQSLGVTCDKVMEEEGIESEISPKHTGDESQDFRTSMLAEELSNINVAIDYKDRGTKARSLSELAKSIVREYYGLLAQKKVTDAYFILRYEVQREFEAIKKANDHNDFLNRVDRDALEDILAFVKSKREMLERGEDGQKLKRKWEPDSPPYHITDIQRPQTTTLYQRIRNYWTGLQRKEV
jgi:hypothetical protein